MQTIQFRVISCSSEDPNFPVSELIAPESDPKGWQSTKFCQYPQEIIIQLEIPSRLKQIQFLSHQSKISSRLELYTYFSQSEIIQDLEFQKLGYVVFDNNEKSNFQARELKSVQVDVECQLLKMIFYKPYLNRLNLSAQVSIILLKCFGEPVELKPVQNQPTPKQQEIEQPEISQYQQRIKDRLQILEKSKNIAIANQNFEEAKRVKDQMDETILIANQISKLEDRKAFAIKKEDFDNAKIIKQEIIKILDDLENPPELSKEVSDQSNQTAEEISQYQEAQQDQINSNQFNEDEINKVDQFDLSSLNLEPEPLSLKYKQNAASLMPFLGEDMCRRLFSQQ